MSNFSQFNLVQNVFTLNMFSNFASSKKADQATLQADLTTIVDNLLGNEFLQQTMGKWNVVWGPVVGSYGTDAKREAASNAMFVANQGNQYIVAVSATNPTSLYGWFVEDFDVRDMVTWKWALENAGTNANGWGATETNNAIIEGLTPCISAGTYLGINHLLSMEGPGIVDNQTSYMTLMAFLAATFSGSNAPAQLVVSGHSLGGALSPTLALYIDENQATWNPAQTVVVSTVPTAGATPGNQAFSNYQNSVMGLRTLRFWNKLDPVPHGWQPDTVELVPFLYYPYIKPGTLFKAITGIVLEQSMEGSAKCPEGGFYTPLQPQAPPLPGQVNLSYTGNLSASQVLQMLVDIGVEEMLSLFHPDSNFFDKYNLLLPLLIDAVNLALKTFANQEDIDTLLQKIEKHLSTFPDQAAINEVITVVGAILAQLENVMLYLTQLAFQHVTSYAFLIGTSSIHELTQGIINSLVLNGGLSPEYTNLVDNLNNPVLLVTQMAGAVGNLIEGAIKNDVTLVKKILDKHALGMI
jgi:hypothetical protein